MSAPQLPSTPGRPLIGHFFEVMRRGTFDVICEHWRRHGDVFSIDIAGRSLATFIHPDAIEAMLVTQRDAFEKGTAYDNIRLLVGDGVLTAEGEQWRKQRRTIQPCMNHGFLIGMANDMVQATVDLVDRWSAQGLEAFDLYPEMMHLALRILGQALFSVDLSKSAERSSQAFTVALEVLSERGNTSFAPPLSWPTPGNRRLRRALRDLDEIVYRMIDERAAALEAGHPPPSDMISLLLDYRDENGQPMPRRLVHDEIITVFLAGHETTALALTWTWYLLSMYPDAEARMHQELDEVLGGRLPTADDLPHLVYTKQILQESMRVMPPVWSGARDVRHETTLSGYPVRPGQMVVIVPYLTHRHPDFWERPEAFMPERFEASRLRGRHKCAYLPFSTGPRRCVGNHFTMIEAQLAMAVIAQRYRFDVQPGHSIERDHQITMRPRHGMPILARRRDSRVTVVDPRPRSPNLGRGVDRTRPSGR